MPYSRDVDPIGSDAFDRLVAEALDGLPPELAGFMDNLVVLTADQGDEPDLLGLYEGLPLTERDNYGGASGDGLTMPDRVHIYRLALCEACANIDELRHQVALTVIHEVAHHFGIDDEFLDGTDYA
jgi:predicted Zn-dependent protease with MMP-like domain|tara:strand:+ start:158 stop:535 length:378 start_codon:yes stop_codon:yes gene_type:complete